MSGSAQLRVFEECPDYPPGFPQPDENGHEAEVVSGLLAVQPYTEKQNLTELNSTPIKSGRSRRYGSRNLRKLGVSSDKANAQNKNPTTRGRGRPPGTGKWQLLRGHLRSRSTYHDSREVVMSINAATILAAQLDKQFEANESVPVQPITRAKSALFLEPPSEHHFCQNASEENLHLDAGNSVLSAREDIVPCGGAFRKCSSAEVVLIDSSTERSGFPSTCSEPGNRDNGVTTIIKVKDERPNASQETRRVNSQEYNDGDHECASVPGSLPKGGQSTASEHKNDCQNETENIKNWDSTPLMNAITMRHGDITKSCKFQSELFKINCLEGVCKVVKKLQETKFADVNAALLKEFYSFIKDAESVNLDIKWLRKNVDEVQDAMRSASELQELEEAEKVLRLENEERRKAIQVKRVEVSKLRSEIELQEEELDLALLSGKELKAQIKCIKSRYCSSDYLMKSML